MTTHEKIVKNTDVELWREPTDEPGMSYYMPSIHVTEQGGIGINVGGTVYVKSLEEWHKLAGDTQTLIESAKREVLEEMRPANATIESMRIYTPRTHTYMGKEYPACSICGFCPEAMSAFIDAQLEQSEESI